MTRRGVDFILIIHIMAYYVAIINISLFILMGMDKYKAQKRKRRTPEATLLTFAFLGGALGGWIGMYAFRHKTKHVKFILGFPFLFSLHIVLITILFLNG